MKKTAGLWPATGTLCGLEIADPGRRMGAGLASGLPWSGRIDFGGDDESRAWLIRAPSGAGKSSLVAWMNGLRKDHAGKLSFFYREFPASPIRERTSDDLDPDGWALIRRRHMATVFQDFRLIPWLSIAGNLSLHPDNPGQPDAIAAWCEKLELPLDTRIPAGQLSRGEQQRLAIIRALLTPARLLLLDEAFSHLDGRLRRLAASFIAEQCRQNHTGILAFDLEDSRDFEWAGILAFPGHGRTVS